jgi:hypothetical protein
VLFEAGKLATGSNVTADPLMPFWATSAAAGLAGNFVGRLQAALPELWPETHRALAVDSATWPQPIRKQLIGRGAHWKTLSKTDRQKFFARWATACLMSSARSCQRATT